MQLILSHDIENVNIVKEALIASGKSKNRKPKR